MKPTHQQVISITAFLFFSLFLMNCYSEDIPISKSDTPTQPGQSRAPFYIPLIASYTTEEVNLNFTTGVGVVTITITDDSGAVFYHDTIDTFLQPNLYIPIYTWNTADYLIIIQFGSITLNGRFSIE